MTTSKEPLTQETILALLHEMRAEGESFEMCARWIMDAIWEDRGSRLSTPSTGKTPGTVERCAKCGRPAYGDSLKYPCNDGDVILDGDPCPITAILPPMTEGQRELRAKAQAGRKKPKKTP